MVGNSAIKCFARLPLSSSSPSSLSLPPPSSPGGSGGTGHVIGNVLIASGSTIAGLAFVDPFLGHSPPYWRVNTSTGIADLVASRLCSPSPA
ncbi:hypothetical protein O1611_g6330 [Lasiodiplodia mahajangana]|uniref:Uncharacterized protein n=1 Tax=Lasiodiplodia mahajangana TaxID=1108764 RepID=A0ACC2JIR4_9PEZI|nr:hypothetical protein O1611_g6330 [Lasiodiplodia mahajangana]